MFVAAVGWVNAINTREVMSSVIELSVMLGSHVFIGAGGGVFINRSFRAANVLYYEAQEWVVYTVGHQRVGEADYGNVVVTGQDTRPAGKYSYYGKLSLHYVGSPCLILSGSIAS